ncbi:MAG: hypothetical protein P8Z76_05605 [Alphaproteobacteria bacterium]
MLRFVFATLMLAILSTLPVVGHAVENGTRAIVSDLSYWALITRLEAAIKRQKLKIISRASVRGAERQKKLGIPGNMVIGAFDDDTTTRILRANVAAGIEAPIRFYVTRGADEKTATLWYRRPSWVLAPYSDRSGDLQAVGEELDRLMATIAAEATGSKTRTNRVMVKRETGKRKAVKPVAKTPKASAPERVAPKRVAKATPARAATTKKPKRAGQTASKPVEAAAAFRKATRPKTAAAQPRKLAPPRPLAPVKLTPAKSAPAKLTSAKPTPAKLTSAKPATPVARAAPKPLTAAADKSSGETPKQGAGKPLETATAGRTAERTGPRTPALPVAKRDPDRDAISLTPLMLKLQGQ